MSANLSPNISWTGFLFRCAAGVLLFFALEAFGERVKLEYERREKTTEVVGQPHYYGLAELPEMQNRDRVLWAELGRGSNGVDYLHRNEGFDVTWSGFTIGEPWDREVSWSLRSKDTGRLDVRFPPGEAKAAAVFLTDGDGYWRTAEIRTGGTTLFAHDLHNGRWFFLRVEKDENARGEKTIELAKLTGDDVAVSALVLLK